MGCTSVFWLRLIGCCERRRGGSIIENGECGVDEDYKSICCPLGL